MTITAARLAPLALALTYSDDDFHDAYRNDTDETIIETIRDRAADCSNMIHPDADAMINSDEFTDELTNAIRTRALFLELD